MRTFGIPFVALALAALVGLGVATPSSAQADQGRYQRVDRNHDGYVSPRERALAHQRWVAHQRWLAQQRYRAQHYGHPGPRHWDNRRRAFNWADRNNDGRIGPREYQRAKRVFNRLDRNHDGRLGPRERGIARQVYRSHQGDHNGDWDRNRYDNNRHRR